MIMINETPEVILVPHKLINRIFKIKETIKQGPRLDFKSGGAKKLLHLLKPFLVSIAED